MATQETFGVTPVGQTFQRGEQGGIEWFARDGVVDGAAIDLCGACAVVEGFGAAFDFQRMHAELSQAFHMLDGT
ncbi:hypothetical protein D3C80_1455090 [compost metagenome]